MKQYQPQKGRMFNLIWYTNVLLSTALSSYLLHLIANDRLPMYIVTSRLQAYAVIAIFLIIHLLIREILGRLKQSRPSLAGIHNCLNNIINNTVLYLTILVCLNFTENYEDIYTEKQVLQVMEIFIWGRILFSVGYSLGTVVGAQSLRSYGLGLCMGSLVTLFTPLNHYDFIAVFR